MLLGLLVSHYQSQQYDLLWTMVNVKQGSQGDAHVIQAKNGKTVLIDAGFKANADTNLIGYLKKNNIQSFDYVFISHPHKDHYEGLLSLLENNISIHNIIFNVPPREICDPEIPWGCDYNNILYMHSLLKEQGAAIPQGKAEQNFDLGNNVTLKILYAFDAINTPVGKTDINDLSLVMKLEVAGKSVLFTGDLNNKIGTWLAQNGKNLQADILKVPHHGTEGLAPNSFFDVVAAKYALVPSPTWLWCSARSSRSKNYFLDKNIPVFISGFHGNVQVKFQNGNFSILAENKTPDICM